jgi:hypothetical protein
MGDRKYCQRERWDEFHLKDDSIDDGRCVGDVIKVWRGEERHYLLISALRLDKDFKAPSYLLRMTTTSEFCETSFAINVLLHSHETNSITTFTNSYDKCMCF